MSSTTRGPTIDDAHPTTLAELPAVLAARAPERPALVFRGRSTSYAEFERGSARVAAALRAEGVEPGTRVAVLARDADHVYEALFGIVRAGGVAMGINVRLAPPEVRFVLEDGEARVLLADADLLARLGSLPGDLPALRKVVLWGPAHAATGAVGGASPEAYPAWRDAPRPPAPLPEPGPGDVAVQMYTSGTTGRPKGVLLPHRSFFAVVAGLRAAGDPWIGWGPEDVVLCALPSFHIGGLWWAVTGLAAGARCVLMDAFEPGEALRLFETERVTKACLVPAMIRMALAEPGAAGRDLGSLGHLVYGGSPVTAELLERARGVFGDGLTQIYGLTETGNTAVCLRPEEHAGERLRAAGRPYPNVELRCCDPDGRPLPPRTAGELWIRSPANMLGYWNRPEATAETLVDGWVRTGDAGWIDEEGFAFVHDRIKDLVLVAGENVSPAEVEDVLAACPGVREVAVIGVPDERWGEAVKALVVPEPGARPRVRELLARARERLADFKVPRTVDFVDALPRTPSGKVRKAELRAPFWAGRERNVN